MQDFFVPTSIRLSVALALALVLVTGCSSAPSTLIFRVTDAHRGTPIEGARVAVEPLSLFVPVYPYPTLELGNPPTSRAETSADGLVRTSASTNRPSRLLVTFVGFEPWSAELTPHIRRGAIEWVLSNPLRTIAMDSPQLHVEIVPGSADESDDGPSR